MAFKLLLEGESQWRRVDWLHLVALVQAGLKLPDGKMCVLPDLAEEARQDAQIYPISTGDLQ